jgi:glycosyltransferase involved in cell wall biosynthesis
VSAQLRILLVAYFYPPSRDTGAHRPAAMAKYLRRLGHQVTVLTTSAYGRLPDDEGPQTASFSGDVVRTADLQVLRARMQGREHVGALFDSNTYSGRPHILSRIVVPEPLALAWAPFARRAARRLQKERPFDCVLTSSPPESAHLVGRAGQRRGSAWVADLRDAWTFEPLRPAFPTGVQRHLDKRLERSLLSAADAVVCVSRPAADDLRRRGIAEPVLIPNGWDPESAPPPPDEAEPGVGLDPERFSLVYTGRFGSYGRDPEPLVRALAALAHDDPGVARRLELVIAGPLTDAERRLLSTDVEPARIVLAGSLPREGALALQRRADALLLIAHPTRSQLFNFKLFEYLAAGRPILALAAGTEAGRIAAEVGAGEPVPAGDPGEIEPVLRRLATDGLEPPPEMALAPYSYPGPAERMAEAIETAIARRSQS